MEWKFLMVRYIYTWDTILFDRNIFSPDESLRINLSKCNIDWKSLNSYFWFCTNIEWLGLRPEFTVPVQEMAKQELSECLKKFYLCIRKKDGSFFKVSSWKRSERRSTDSWKAFQTTTLGRLLLTLSLNKQMMPWMLLPSQLDVKEN